MILLMGRDNSHVRILNHMTTEQWRGWNDRFTTRDFHVRLTNSISSEILHSVTNIAGYTIKQHFLTNFISLERKLQSEWKPYFKGEGALITAETFWVSISSINTLQYSDLVWWEQMGASKDYLSDKTLITFSL